MKAQSPRAARPLAQRYWLTRLLAVGGMAEIHLARQGALGDTGPGGDFHKELVIKRLRPELAGDPRVVGMFLDEARIGALLHHPHVVQVFDAGDDDGAPYIAMEYIRGEELNELCRRGLAAGRFLPLEHAVEICRQAACALGHVHALRDGDDRSLDIVHCDVSPSNLLVTGDGYLKLIDFGIARARGQRRRDEQALPGKLSYMSPEQARRAALDHRSDIFSLGVVLYEITVGQRLFRGPAREVRRRLERGEVEPPTFVRRDFPGMLESIIMRALEAAPGDRYASAYDMADELEDFLRESGSRSGPLRLARYLDDLAVSVGGERRADLVSERERRGDEEALDFDRGVFDGYRAGGGEPRAPLAEWDEFEEDEHAVAAALGVDTAVVRVAAAGTAADHSAAPRRDPAADPGEEPGDETQPESVAGRLASSGTPLLAGRLPPAAEVPATVPDALSPTRPVIGSPGLDPRIWVVLALVFALVMGAVAALLLRSLVG